MKIVCSLCRCVSAGCRVRERRRERGGLERDGEREREREREEVLDIYENRPTLGRQFREELRAALMKVVVLGSSK